MKVSVWIEIKGNIDSLMLWELIKDYKMNLTALDDVVLVYGDCSYLNAGIVISKCALFGEVTAKLRRGCGDEQKKKEEA